MLTVYDINFKTMQGVEFTFLAKERNLILFSFLIEISPLKAMHKTACKKRVENNLSIYHAAFSPTTLNFTTVSIPY